MLRLKTFGAISIVGENGETVTALDSQRRSLALLCALAVAGTRGLTRDKLLALLWPESDPERASHSLTQSLYATRRAARIDDLFLTAGVVRLNAERLESDVIEFAEAIEAGDLETAAALYDGPFMDGFFLQGAADFSQWLSGQRARYEEDALNAIELLAVRAEERRDYRQAAAWRKKCVRLKPLDSGTVGKLIVCLGRSGDRAAALEHAVEHERALKNTLGLTPDAGFVELVASVRQSPVLQLDVANRFSIGEKPESSGDVPVQSVASNQTPRTRSHVATLANTRSLVRRLRSDGLTIGVMRKAVVAAILLMFAGLGVWNLRVPGAKNEVEARSANRVAVVAVMPFGVSGANSAISHLGLGLAELLADRLADDSTSRIVEPGVVFKQWRAAGFDSVGSASRDSTIALGARLGATRVIIGRIVGTRARSHASVSLVSVASNETIATAEVESSADSIGTFAEDLAIGLLVDEAGRTELLASRRPRSLRAVRSFLTARSAMTRGEYAAAGRLFEATARADSTFPEAELEMAIAAERLGDGDRASEAIARVWERRDELDTEGREQLAALTGPNYPRPSTRAEQLAAWEEPVHKQPRHAENWSLLALHLVRDGARLGSPTYRSQALTALRRALALSPGDIASHDLLAQLRSNDSLNGGGPSAGTQLIGDMTYSPFAQWRSALARGDSAALRRIRAAFPQLSRSNLRAIALFSEYDPRGLMDGSRALQLLKERAKTVVDQVDVILAEHSFALNRGDVPRALATTTRLRDARPDSHGYLRMRVLDAIYGAGDSAAAKRAAAELSTPLDSTFANFPLSQSQAASDACVLAQWKLQRADTMGVRATAARLRRVGSRHAPQIVAASPLVCADLVDAMLAVQTRQPDAEARVNSLDSMVFTTSVAGDAALYAHLAVSRMYLKLGDRVRARQAIARRSYMAGWSPYVTSTLLEEGILAELTGDKSLAGQAYSQYQRLRGNSIEAN